MSTGEFLDVSLDLDVSRSRFKLEDTGKIHMHSAWALKKKNSTNSEEKDLLVKKVASTFVAPSSREFKGFESEHAASQTSDFCERKSKLGKKG